MRSTLFAAAFTTLIAASDAILPVYTKGQKFFTSDGNQWFAKGVAYQRTGDDPLVDTVQCQLDAALMKTLGANSIRVYHVDAAGNHDGCMQAFADAGVYLFVDLDNFADAIGPTNSTWTQRQYSAFAARMDTFQKYDNTVGFFIGNEVIDQTGEQTLAMAYIKAAVVDMKNYRASKGYRNIPIGYSHADVAGLRPVLQDYLACGNGIEFFGLNAYEWCGTVTYDQSGYHALEEQTVDYPVPIFFSETGCNQPEPRSFLDQTAVFGPMAVTWSGAIIYEWKQEDNHYGIITYGGGNTDASDYAAPAPSGYSISGTPTPITPDFANLQNVWRTSIPTSTAAAAYVDNLPVLACPAVTPGVWLVDPAAPLPTVGGALAPAPAPVTTTTAVVPPSSSIPVIIVATSTSVVPAPTSAPVTSAPPLPASSTAPVVVSIPESGPVIPVVSIAPAPTSVPVTSAPPLPASSTAPVVVSIPASGPVIPVVSIASSVAPAPESSSVAPPLATSSIVLASSVIPVLISTAVVSSTEAANSSVIMSSSTAIIPPVVIPVPVSSAPPPSSILAPSSTVVVTVAPSSSVAPAPASSSVAPVTVSSSRAAVTSTIVTSTVAPAAAPATTAAAAASTSRAGANRNAAAGAAGLFLGFLGLF